MSLFPLVHFVARQLSMKDPTEVRRCEPTAIGAPNTGSEKQTGNLRPSQAAPAERTDVTEVHPN